MIKVSVIMPVYNGEKFIERTSGMILNQSLKEIELILVNDGSKDNYAALCDKIAEGDPRVRVIHQSNQGICGDRNAWIKEATGE